MSSMTWDKQPRPWSGSKTLRKPARALPIGCPHSRASHASTATWASMSDWAQVAQQIAAASSEPAVLAQAAQSLIEAGAVEEGMRMAERVDPARLSAHDAYELTQAQGKALLRYAPRRALDKLEEGVFHLSRSAHPRWGSRLVRYLPRSGPACRRTAHDHGNRRLCAGEPGRRAEANRCPPCRGVTTWRASAITAKPSMPTPWSLKAPSVPANSIPSRHRKSNGHGISRPTPLLEGFRFSESLALLDEIAASNAPWAQEASLKAEFARAEQRLRGGPETPQESR